MRASRRTYALLLEVRLRYRAFSLAVLFMLTFSACESNGTRDLRELVSADATAEEVLELCPCVEADRDRFPVIGGSSPTAVPPPIENETPVERETRLRTQLAERLARRDPALVREGLRLFDGSTRSIPDPALRAALALLIGTEGEPAIDSLFGDEQAPVLFGQTHTGFVAQAFFSRGSRSRVLVNTFYRHEDPILLAPILAHEALHDSDARGGRYEELVVTFIEQLVHARLQAEYPESAELDTPLAKESRLVLLRVVFNSRSPVEARGQGAPLAEHPLFESLDAGVGPSSVYVERILRGFGLEFDEPPEFSHDLMSRIEIAALIDAPESWLTGKHLLELAERNSIGVE